MVDSKEGVWGHWGHQGGMRTLGFFLEDGRMGDTSR